MANTGVGGYIYGHTLVDTSIGTQIKFTDIGHGGDIGPQGPKGDQGLSGPIGPEGPRGLQGVKGDQGLQGIQGPSGLQGISGRNGVDGDIGPQGPRGDKGERGQAGNDGTVGMEGPIGPTGPQGAEGLSGKIGPQGEDGSEGPQGPQGRQGDLGPVGPAGLTWRGRYDLSVPYTVDDAVGYQGATYFCIQDSTGNPPDPITRINNYWSLMAAEGVRGPEGPVGPQGPKGDQGVQGVSVKGDKGDLGPVGNEGPTGPQGSLGNEGPRGDKGDTGETGPIGPKGDDGERGPQGPEGPTGQQGPKGDENTDLLVENMTDVTQYNKDMLRSADSAEKFNEMLGNRSYLIETGKSTAGASLQYWYRKYSDGYQELYMEIPPSNNLNDISIDLPVPFKTEQYSISRSNMSKRVDTYSFHQFITSRSTTRITFSGLTAAYCTLQTFFLQGY